MRSGWVCLWSLLLSGAGADEAHGAILCVPLAGTSSRGPEPPGRTVPLVRVQEGRRAPERGVGGGGGGRVAGMASVAHFSTQPHIEGCLFSLHSLLCN